jgi:hypothetical protein
VGGLWLFADGKEEIMAVVRSLEGTFYDIPEGKLEKFKVPADQVKGLMDAAGQQMPQNPPQQQTQMGQQATGGQPQILVQFITQSAGGSLTQGQPQGAPAEGEEEKVEPQWYRYRYWWANWYNWRNWYNWY